MNPIETHHLEESLTAVKPAKVSPTSAASTSAQDDEGHQQEQEEYRAAGILLDTTLNSTSTTLRNTRNIATTYHGDGNLPISPISALAPAAGLDDLNISENDVLFGRGGGTNRHIGNVYFRELVSEYQPAYIQARKRDKTMIAKTIVAQVRNRNGRFLRKQENGNWVDVGDKKAAEKTSQALREGLSGRMREIVKEGGVGLQKLKKIGFSLYEDNITREDVQRRLKCGHDNEKASPCFIRTNVSNEMENDEDTRKQESL
mmetsp:Transcript_10555/g.19702  ORF Transcript_10555/g.19702 Transcript_10555/m.19702 type:complete len:259 (-) Transcript_10555:472-1248(-)